MVRMRCALLVAIYWFCAWGCALTGVFACCAVLNMPGARGSVLGMLALQSFNARHHSNRNLAGAQGLSLRSMGTQSGQSVRGEGLASPEFAAQLHMQRARLRGASTRALRR